MVIHPGREDYAAAVCPTCETFTCRDGYECQMVDDYPLCIEKQTGCDNDM